MAGLRIEGATSNNVAEVNSNNELKVALSNIPANIGGIRNFSENDPGAIVSGPWLMSPETDIDFRLRAAQDTLLDDESFNYTAQNTGKHTYVNTTVTAAWTSGNLLLNSGSGSATTTGAYVRTYAAFPCIGTQTLSMDFSMGLSSAGQTNTFIEAGLFVPSGATTAPADGVFFRLSSAGMQGIVNYGGVETSTGIFPTSSTNSTPWTYTLNKRYQYIVYVTAYACYFWINDFSGNDALNTNLMGVVPLPAGQGRMVLSTSLPAAFQHRITGGAGGGVVQAQIGGYSVRTGGAAFPSLGEASNRMYGSFQGFSGGTMGSLASYANSANPTSAAGSNTAALVTGLGGQCALNAAAAAATDFILTSYQVPAVSTTAVARRLKVTSIRISAVNMGAAVATTATTVALSIAFGHTAVSLATAEAATTKAPRRVALGHMYWPVGAVIGAEATNGDIVVDFTQGPIYVNPGEFFAVACKFLVGTATASQSLWFHITPVYAWE